MVFVVHSLSRVPCFCPSVALVQFQPLLPWCFSSVSSHIVRCTLRKLLFISSQLFRCTGRQLLFDFCYFVRDPPRLLLFFRCNHLTVTLLVVWCCLFPYIWSITQSVIFVVKFPLWCFPSVAFRQLVLSVSCFCYIPVPCSVTRLIAWCCSIQLVRWTARYLLLLVTKHLFSGAVCPLMSASGDLVSGAACPLMFVFRRLFRCAARWFHLLVSHYLFRCTARRSLFLFHITLPVALPDVTPKDYWHSQLLSKHLSFKAMNANSVQRQNGNAK